MSNYIYDTRSRQRYTLKIQIVFKMREEIIGMKEVEAYATS